MRRTLTAIISILILGCSSAPPQQRHADLVVTYFDKKIKHEKPTWTNEARLREVLKKSGKKFLVFGADWCGSCNFLRRALREGELLEHVEFINVDEKWANHIMQFYGVESIPTMFELDSKSNITNIKIGPGQIVVHLLVHIEEK